MSIAPGNSAPSTSAPSNAAPSNAAPGSAQSTETDGLLRRVEDELSTLEGVDTPAQVPVFERMHATLAEALARTADTGASPGEPGA